MSSDAEPKDIGTASARPPQLPTAVWKRVLDCLPIGEQDDLRFSIKIFFEAMREGGTLPYWVAVEPASTQATAKGPRPPHMMPTLKAALASFQRFHSRYPHRRFEIRLTAAHYYYETGYSDPLECKNDDESLVVGWGRFSGLRLNRCINEDRGTFNSTSALDWSGLRIRTPEVSAWYTLRGLTSAALLPEARTRIAKDAFFGCQHLTTLKIPRTVTSVGSQAFYLCSSLISLTLPEGLTSIGDAAFVDCWALQKLTLPTSLTSLGEGVFEDCSALTSMFMPESLTDLPASTFHSCHSLVSVSLPATISTIGRSCFAHCRNMILLTLPQGLKHLEQDLFYMCGNLQFVALPDGLESIGDRAFWMCLKLVSVTWPSALQSIGEDAFGNCVRLQSVELPEGLRTIGDHAFRMCPFRAVTLPTGVEHVGEGAFDHKCKVTVTTSA